MSPDRSSRRFLLPLAVWTLIGLVFGAQNYLTAQYANTPYSWSQALGLALAEWYFWGALFPGFLAVARRFPWDRGRWPLSFVVHVPLVLLVTLLRVALESLALEATGFAPPRDGSLLLNSGLLTCGLVFGAAHALSYARISRERSHRALELESSLAQARLRLLESQLQPHFLFNTLHSIATLMQRDVPAAETMLARLSDLLRLALESGEREEVPLHDELELTRLYLEIQQVRFGDRLRAEWAVEPEARDALVPSMIVQPLVENGVQHGVAPQRQGGRVTLAAQQVDGCLVLSVEDDGPGLGASAAGLQEGRGLRITRERLERRYGDRHGFEIGPGREGGVRVSLRVPLAREGEA